MRLPRRPALRGTPRNDYFFKSFTTDGYINFIFYLRSSVSHSYLEVQGMNNRERFMTALKLGEPDRVPIFDLGFNEESILNVGRHFTSDLQL